MVVAVCDEELLGRSFNDRKKGLSLRIGESFYKGSKVKVDESIDHVKSASIANLVGSRIVKKAVSHGIVNPLSVLVIAGIPHVQIIRMRRS